MIDAALSAWRPPEPHAPAQRLPAGLHRPHRGTACALLCGPAGFGVEFEAKVATELGSFCAAFDATRDGLWLALDGDEVLGWVAIVGSGAAAQSAHLRWFIVADRLRGSGAGRRLIEAALGVCDQQRYAKVYLWTFDQLHAARHLYEKRGFTLTRT